MSVHILAVISWMAGILYLFRLFVYHAGETEAVVKSRFKIMEYRLYKYITAPAMVVAFGMGVWMLFLNPSLLQQAWMHAKLFFVVLLIGVTHYAGRLVKTFAADQNRRPERFFRIMNEMPTLLMIFIVFLVILKPF
jgi:putative membrane protein